MEIFEDMGGCMMFAIIATIVLVLVICVVVVVSGGLLAGLMD